MKARYRAPVLVWHGSRSGHVSTTRIGDGTWVIVRREAGRYVPRLQKDGMPGRWNGPSYSTLYNAKRGAARWLVALGLV